MSIKPSVFYINNMQCGACQTLIEQQLQSVPGVGFSVFNLKQQSVRLSLDERHSQAQWLLLLNQRLKPYQYELSLMPFIKNTDDLWLALPMGLLVLLLFVFIQQSGLLSIGLNAVMSPLFSSWFIGLVASLSSCLVVVGGLVLSLSGDYRAHQAGGSARGSLVYFHVGRLLGFFVLGSVLGGLGQLVSINVTFSALVGLLASCMMLLMGLRLTGLLPYSRFMLLNNLSLYRYIKQPRIPLLIGAATFFLPCGFTQSMQLLALASGSWQMGGLMMLLFALGTLPMLAFLSFGSAAMAQSTRSALFLKTLGVVVVGLGLLTLLMGLVSLGVLQPMLRF